MVANTYRNGTLHHADALAVASEMAAGSVSLVYCDGPYGLGFGEWDRATGGGLVDWYAPHFDAFDRVCAPSASLAVWGTTRSWAYLHVELERRGWTQCGQVVWDKGNATTSMRADPKMARSWPQTHEIVGLYRRDGIAAPSVTHSAGADDRNWIREWMRSEWRDAGLTLKQANEACGTATMAGHYFGRLQWCLPTWDRFQTLAKYANKHGKPRPERPWLVHPSAVSHSATFEHLRAEFEHLRAEFEHLRAEYESLRAPFEIGTMTGSVWSESTPTLRGGRHGHPCQKPDGITRKLIETLTRPGDLVFEPFGGSSPAGRACEAMPAGSERRWVSCETDEAHYRRTVEMLSSVQGRLL